MRYVVTDEFEKIVDKISTALTPSLSAYDPKITGVHYQHGHIKEIIETLTEISKATDPATKAGRYPLFALLQDFTEENDGTYNFDFRTNLHIIIAVISNPTYKAAERMEKSFKPVLYPIYYETLRQINACNAIMTKGIEQIVHTKTDRLYWGNKGIEQLDNTGKIKNIFNDWVDAIEIKLRDVKFYPNNKC